jgi:SAM-dependent methyltransferase
MTSTSSGLPRDRGIDRTIEARVGLPYPWPSTSFGSIMAYPVNSDFPAPSPASRRLDMIHASWMSSVVTLAAELGLFDHLAAGARHATALAAATGCETGSLRRLLRALASLDLCVEDADGSFAPTELGALLRSDTPDSLRGWALWWGQQIAPVWRHLEHSVRTGTASRALATARDGFTALTDDPALATRFHQALAELTRRDADDIIADYDFSGLSTIADLGGGHGQLLARVLAACPTARGVLFELPHALAGARGLLASAGLSQRCTIVAGDFFVAVPAGADLYVLKSVLHDWDDDRSVALLRNCRAVLTGGARLLLIEVLLPERSLARPPHQTWAREDLSMLLLHGSRERTLSELRSLVKRAGLTIRRVVPSRGRFGLVELVRAESTD